MHYRLTIVVVCLLTVALVITTVSADQDLAKQSQNPIGNMISLPMQNNTYFDVGPSDEWANSFQFQPVYPVNFGKVNLINRFIIPINYLAEQILLPLRQTVFSAWATSPGRDLSHRPSRVSSSGGRGRSCRFRSIRMTGSAPTSGQPGRA